MIFYSVELNLAKFKNKPSSLSSMTTFVIEHLEPRMYPWCLLEYKHISQIVGKGNLIFTNVKKGAEKLKKLGEVKKESVKDLKLQKACILDPSAKKLLTPKEAKKFDYFIFGGILGDNPQRFRTKRDLTSKLKLPAFNLGPKQMSTDTAVYVTKKIIDGTPLEKLKFVEEIEFEDKDGCFVGLPFRYVIEDGKTVMAKGLREFVLKHQRLI